MTDAAPRLDSRILAAVAWAHRDERPIAETNRRVGRVAEELGLSRPSYEAVRRVVHDVRASRRRPDAGDVLLAIAFRSRPPEAIMELFV